MCTQEKSIRCKEFFDNHLPMLRNIEKFVTEKLTAKIVFCREPGRKLELQRFQAELELELAMIHTLLESLSERCRDQAQGKPGAGSDKADDRLVLHTHEAVAIETLRQLNERCQDLENSP